MSKVMQEILEVRNASLAVQAAAAFVLLVGLMALYSILSTVVDGYYLSQQTGQLQAQIQASNLSDIDQDMKNLVSQPLFGVAKEQQIERVNTSLNLLGVMTSADEASRRAFIAEPNKDAKVYMEGDEISKGLIVSKIGQDRVTLKRFGVPETLYIAWDKIKNSNNAQSNDNKRSSIFNRKDRSNKNVNSRYTNGYPGHNMTVRTSVNYREFLENGGTREQYLEKVREEMKDLRSAGAFGGF